MSNWACPKTRPRNVDKAFDILLRKSRSRQQDDRFEQEYEAKVKAYKMIIEAEERSKVEEMSRQRYAKWGKFAGTAEKIDDFFRLYKTHCIIALVAVIAIVFGLNAYLDHREEQKDWPLFHLSTCPSSWSAIS